MRRVHEDGANYSQSNTFPRESSCSIAGKDNMGYSDPSICGIIALNEDSCVSLRNFSTGRALNKNIDVAPDSSNDQLRWNPSIRVSPESPNSASKTGGLERNLGFVGAVSLIVGSMIGSGIFASGSAVASRSRSPGMILCVWSGCGLLATLGALCYAELGTAIPKSGSEHSCLTYAFGDLGGFMYAWVSILVLKPSAQAGICSAFGAYIVEALGSMAVCASEKYILIKLLAAFAIGRTILLKFESIFFKCTHLCYYY